MAMPRKVPDIGQLVAWRDMGLTHQQMADRIFEETGQKVSRSSISVALSRAGKVEDKPRYLETIPWKVKTAHLKEYPARMLRLLGRRRAGGELTANENQRLDRWLQMLADGNAVVGYDPDNLEQGFHYIDPRKGDGKNGVPIHVQKIRTTPLAKR